MEGFMVVSDESVNNYRFRVLSSGGDFTRFKKNPVMLYVHERSAGGKAKLPIGRWENLQVTSDGRIMANPVFNEKNPEGLAAKESFDGGFLNAASMQIEPIEWSEDPEQMLPGQMLPTVTKWELLEISMADLPVNANSVRLSYHGNSLKMSADDGADNTGELKKLFYAHKPVSSMKSIIAVLNTQKLGLSLGEDAKEGEVLTALQKALSLKDDALTAKETLNLALTKERDELKLAKADAETKAINDRATDLVNGAESAKKITAKEKEHYMKLAKADFDSTKAILDGFTGFTSVSGQLNKDGAAVELSVDEEKVKRYDELRKTGKLKALKLSKPDEFKELHLAKWGKPYVA